MSDMTVDIVHDRASGNLHVHVFTERGPSTTEHNVYIDTIQGHYISAEKAEAMAALLLEAARVSREVRGPK